MLARWRHANTSGFGWESRIDFIACNLKSWEAWATIHAEHAAVLVHSATERRLTRDDPHCDDALCVSTAVTRNCMRASCKLPMAAHPWRRLTCVAAANPSCDLRTASTPIYAMTLSCNIWMRSAALNHKVATSGTTQWKFTQHAIQKADCSFLSIPSLMTVFC